MKKQTSEKYVSEALNRLDFVILETNKILVYFKNVKKSETLLFCVLMSERINHASYALKNLLKDFLSVPQLEYSCGIILRSILLDYMIVLNAMIKMSDDQDKGQEDGLAELDMFCSTMLNECVNYTLRDITKLKISKEDSKIFYKNFATMYSECLEPYNSDGSIPIAKTIKTYSPGKLFEKIYNDKDFRQYANAYDAYLFYSKYDHFGRMYHDFSNHELNKRSNRINESTKIFPKAIQFISAMLYILNRNDKVVKKQFDDMQEYIRNL